jgi:hypothetical protein
MIISTLFGGLGNQMFCYAAGLSLAYLRNTVLKLDLSDICQSDSQRPLGLDCFNLNMNLATADEIWKLNGKTGRKQDLMRKILLMGGQWRLADYITTDGQAHYQEDWCYYPAFHSLPRNTWLYGSFQSERFFLPASDLVRQQFTFRRPIPDQFLEVADAMSRGPSVAIHFRLGDYLQNPSKLVIQPVAYYEQAIRYISERVPADTTYYVFSDDIEHVRQSFSSSVPIRYVDGFNQFNDYEAMRLMSMCNHNIIANSTFSWWAAWLNSNPSKIVIAPSQWFALGYHDNSDMYPESWHKI